jgi:hypothetical protein
VAQTDLGSPAKSAKRAGDENMAFSFKRRRKAGDEEPKQPLRNLFTKVKLAVGLAEELFGAGSGKEKRAWVIATLNKAVDIPVIPENMEALFLGLLIDFVVDLFNEGQIGNGEHEVI